MSFKGQGPEPRFPHLRHGDRVRNLRDGQQYTIVRRYGVTPMAVRSVEVEDAGEWVKLTNANVAEPT